MVISALFYIDLNWLQCHLGQQAQCLWRSLTTQYSASKYTYMHMHTYVIIINDTCAPVNQNNWHIDICTCSILIAETQNTSYVHCHQPKQQWRCQEQTATCWCSWLHQEQLPLHQSCWPMKTMATSREISGNKKGETLSCWPWNTADFRMLCSEVSSQKSHKSKSIIISLYYTKKLAKEANIILSHHLTRIYSILISFFSTSDICRTPQYK